MYCVRNVWLRALARSSECTRAGSRMFHAASESQAPHVPPQPEPPVLAPVLHALQRFKQSKQLDEIDGAPLTSVIASHTLALAPDDPRVRHLFPSLRHRCWTPSPYATPMYANRPPSFTLTKHCLPGESVRDARARFHRMHLAWQMSLSPRDRLHDHLLSITRSDRWEFAKFNREFMARSRDGGDVSEWLQSLTLRCEAKLRRREIKTERLALDYYEIIAGHEAAEEVRADLRHAHTLELIANLFERRRTRHEQLQLFQNNPVMGAVEKFVLMQQTEARSTRQLLHLANLLQRLGYDTEQSAALVHCQLNDEHFMARTEQIMHRVYSWQRWRESLLLELLREQSTWCEPAGTAVKEHMRGQFTLLAPVKQRKHKLTEQSNKEKLPSAHLSVRLVRRAQQSIGKWREHPTPDNRPSDIVLSLSSLYSMDSKRFEFELWRHEMLEREYAKRRTEMYNGLAPPLVRQRTQIRFWHFQKRETALWQQVLSEELRKNEHSSSDMVAAIQQWDTQIGSRPVTVLDVVALLSACQSSLAIRDPLPRQIKFAQFDAALHEDTLQQHQSAMASGHTTATTVTQSASLLFYYRPSASHSLGVALVNARLDQAKVLARAVHAAMHQRGQDVRSAPNWLELNPERGGEGETVNIECENETMEHQNDNDAFISALTAIGVSPAALPELVQDGWLMADLGSLMLLACSDQQHLAAWISAEQQGEARVEHQHFLRHADGAVVQHFNALVKPARAAKQ